MGMDEVQALVDASKTLPAPAHAFGAEQPQERPADKTGHQGPRLALAKWLYASRAMRPMAALEGLLGEPGWDLLLDLYIREMSGSRSSITSACIGSRAPHTTALRYVSALCDNGWIKRLPDDDDRRRYWLSLSAIARRKLDSYFDQLLASLKHISIEVAASV